MIEASNERKKRKETRHTRYFRSTVAKMWNNLPQHFRDITSYNVFKKKQQQVNSWSGETSGGVRREACVRACVRACVCVCVCVQTFKFCLLFFFILFYFFACFMLYFLYS